MQKDLKIGLIAGLVLAGIVLLLFSSRAGLNLMVRVPPPKEQDAALYDWPDFNAEDEPFEGSQIDHRLDDEKPVLYHTVKSGQTLSQIAYEYYGSAKNWRKILNANRHAIKDANALTPGVKLIIPD